MRKICLSVIGFYLMVLHAFGQSSPEQSGNYRNLDLRVDEVNILSGYYSQTGNHSPVTGGIGTQQLNDVSNTIQIRLLRWDILERKHSTDWELGIDHHTAASSAYVSKTGASKTGGTRIYPSVTWKIEDEAKRTAVGWGLSYSNEYNYHSYGTHFDFSKTLRGERVNLDDYRTYTFIIDVDGTVYQGANSSEDFANICIIGGLNKFVNSKINTVYNSYYLTEQQKVTLYKIGRAHV